MNGSHQRVQTAPRLSMLCHVARSTRLFADSGRMMAAVMDNDDGDDDDDPISSDPSAALLLKKSASYKRGFLNQLDGHRMHVINLPDKESSLQIHTFCPN